MSQESRKQNLIVIAVAVAIIVISSLLTLYASGVFRNQGDSRSSGYQNVTFTDAHLACQQQTQATYGDRISTLVTDDHSSRYDEREFLYKIFMELNLHSGEGGTKAHYVNCFVRSANGRIRKYEVFVADEEKESPVDDGTNVFGMPKR